MTKQIRTPINTAWHPLINGNPPDWASAWGEDEYGVWVEFTFENVNQRLRWIPPGIFKMGSPKTETGRRDNEGPVHQVIISQGYWLFDTACTQALWDVVMGTNPSHFQSPNHPVEKVSWLDCKEFLITINKEISGLELNLPTEAQWEYACRAGEQEAIYTGAMDILGDANAPSLDAIAWYGGNSGVEFELENGIEITYLSDRQFNLNPSGTHSVGLKDPNALGLYDMQGNVWEWCADGKRDYTNREEIDPLGNMDAGAERVIRGGSWSYLARFCRSACRYWFQPGERLHDLGFRCARGS